jgi:hypothetical protein
LSQTKSNFVGRARWHDLQAVFPPHQLGFDGHKVSLIATPKKMNCYNKLKIRTLNVFAIAPEAWFTPGEVAAQLDFVPRRSAWTYLKRLWRFGLLERRSTGTGTLKYKLSEAGAVRHRWLHSQKS